MFVGIDLTQNPSNRPKASFNRQVEGGDFISIAVWSGKKDPKSEVIVAQIRRREGDNWRTIGRLAMYRTPEGEFSELPDRK